MMSRDLDSRITEREAAAVKEWLDSGDVIHSMRRVLITRRKSFYIEAPSV